MNTEARFWAKVSKDDVAKCWLWTAATWGANSYGAFCLGDKNVQAHRFSWEIANGPIPAGVSVLHRCDVPRCVNPAHLFLGTQGDNVRDCVAKGRSPIIVRLDESVRTEVRKRLAAGAPKRHIARDLGIATRTVLRISREVR